MKMRGTYLRYWSEEETEEEEEGCFFHSVGRGRPDSSRSPCRVRPRPPPVGLTEEGD